MRAFLLLLLLAGLAHADKVLLMAGGNNPDEGVFASEAALKSPFGIDQDKAGNFYLVEHGGHRVRKIDLKGLVTTIAGTGEKGDSGDGGPAVKATFNAPHNLVVGPDGSIYVADTLNHRVRKIDPKGTVTTLAGTGKAGFSGDGGPADKAAFKEAYCVALDPGGKNLYVADLGNRRIRAIDLGTGTIKTVAGNGDKGVPKDGSDATTSPLVDPRAVAVDAKGNIWILERSGHALRVVDDKGKIRTAAGTGTAGDKGLDGPALMAQLRSPKFLIVDRDGNVVIADSDNNRVVKYVPAAGKLVLVAGTGKAGKEGIGGPAKEVQLNQPHGVYQDRDGQLYIVDSSNNRILRIEQ
jgi:DNA-binding beta-propeller fold protein YncE